MTTNTARTSRAKAPATVKTKAAAAAAREVGDTIFVRDFVVDCNVGVYAEEQGVTQKVRFTVEARLDKRVVPRLTTAHSYNSRSLGVYRFLCSLQNQGVAAGMMWSWGALESASFLPRVATGRSTGVASKQKSRRGTRGGMTCAPGRIRTYAPASGGRCSIP